MKEHGHLANPKNVLFSIIQPNGIFSQATNFQHQEHIK
jgi:hypothetical protein